jgi:hypothetical protein
MIGMVLTLALIAAGCGGDEAGETTTTSGTTTSETIADTTTTTSTTTSSTTTSTTTTEPVGETVEVFFSVGGGSDCAQVDAFPRPLAEGADPIRTAFDELVAGPTAEETGAGAGSFFSSESADTVISVTLTDGLLIVDFTDLRPTIPNASTSCGSEALLAQLNATAFQFADVDRTRYRIEGSCDDFANWLQRECFDTDRSGRQLDVSINERASGSGCTPPSGDTLPDGRWFGFITEAQTDQVAFDLACWFTGAAASAAAAEDGEETPPPNDFHIRNDSERLRTLTVEPSAQVLWLPNPGDPASAETVTYRDWLAQQPGRDYAPGVWLEVGSGQITAMEEQYVP